MSATSTVVSTVTETPSSVPIALQNNITGDWRDEFFRNGVVVIKGAIPPERAAYYQQKAFEWLKSFSKDLDLKDRTTWTTDNLPVQSKLNTFDTYSVVHERFMWEARMEPGVVDAFAKLWGTDKLLVSFDSLNITLPNRRPPRTPWPHVDQSPMRPGLACAQGIINLSHVGAEDGSLIAMPGSHLLNDTFFNTQTDKATWEKKDWRRFSEEEMKWWASKGFKPTKIVAEPGDLILWDSRTLHWGGEPTEKSNTIRTVIYASMTPAAWATKEAIEEKVRVFHARGATTHWAHDNIFLRPTVALLEDGTVDPRNRSEPLEAPVMTEKLEKLAGLKAY